MRRLLATGLLAAIAAGAGAQIEPTLLLVGDSTLATRTGYGDVLCERLRPAVACLNLARGGRSTLSYRAEGLWQQVLDRLQAGERRGAWYVLIQFGHNDQPGKPGRSTDLATEYPAHLARYVAEVRAAGGVPLLATPLTRRTFRDGRLVDDLAPWADAVRSVARELSVPLVDVHARSVAAVQAMGPVEADTMAMAAPGAERFDHTHVGPRGACVFADLHLQALLEAVPTWRTMAQPGRDCSRVPPP